MTAGNHHDIAVLNGLVRTTLDSAETYDVAARDTGDARYRGLFESRSFERRRLAGDLQGAVAAMGGRPNGSGSLIAKAQRALTDIRHAVIPDDRGLVGAAEGGEDALKARFERALGDSQISATTRETIRRAYAQVAQDHEQISDLKHSLDAQRDADDDRLYPH